MTKKEIALKNYLKNQESSYSQILGKGINFLEPDNIWTILQIELNKELLYGEILLMGLTADEITDIVLKYIEKQGLFFGKIQLDLDQDSIELDPDLSDDLIKATIKQDNKVWIIHKNDVDPFPSSPHAHNYKENITLNLKTGEIFKHRKRIGKLKTKEFDRIIKTIKQEFPGIKLPDL